MKIEDPIEHVLVPAAIGVTGGGHRVVVGLQAGDGKSAANRRTLLCAGVNYPEETFLNIFVTLIAELG